MANAIPPPAQRLINCLRNTSSSNQSKGIKCLALLVALAFLGAVVTLGLGLAKKLPKNLETPLTMSFTGLIILLGMVLIVFSLLNRFLNGDHHFHQPVNNPMLGLPRLLRIPSDDSGVGSSSSSLLDVQGNGSRENLHGSHDSGINVI